MQSYQLLPLGESNDHRSKTSQGDTSARYERKKRLVYYITIGVALSIVILYAVDVSAWVESISSLSGLTPTFDSTPAPHLAPIPAEWLDQPLVEPESLKGRLQAFRHRPVLSHEEASPINHIGCPMGTYDRDKNEINLAHLSEWPNIDRDQIIKARDDIVSHIHSLIAAGVPVRWNESLLHPPHQTSDYGLAKRGILYAAGNRVPKSLDRIKVSLRMLRETLKSQLPVEIFHYRGEIDDEEKKEIVARFGQNIAFRETGEMEGARFEIKNRAFIETSFTQFVWLDSDTIPLVDPATMFESTEFLTSGNIFWADNSKDHPDNAVWRVLDRWCTDENLMAETGQVVFDKRGNGGLNLAALHIALYMMRKQDLWGKLSWGDKDLFRYAFYVLGIHYQDAPVILSAVGNRPSIQNDYNGIDITKNGDFCGYANLHWAPTPRTEADNPLYRHRPGFLRANVIKIHPEIHSVSDFLARVRRPKIDDSSDPRLVRATVGYHGNCLRYDLFGPDGEGVVGVDSMGDGQGMLEIPLKDAWRDGEGKVSRADKGLVKALMQRAEEILRINHS